MIHGCSLAKNLTSGEEKGVRDAERKLGVPYHRGGTWSMEKERERRGKDSPCLNPFDRVHQMGTGYSSGQSL